ncbi:retrotransposon protein, putative, ty1-copia subclass [Tanacetum coccineum]
MQSMKDNQVWVLVDLPPNGRTVENIRAIRILLAIAAFYDYEIWQINVKTAFLTGHLSEDVYMVKPKGFVDPKLPYKMTYYSLERTLQYCKKLNLGFVENSKKGYTPMIEKPDYRKSQCAKKPSETAVKTILKYLRNTKDMVLVYGEKSKAKLKVSCYADSAKQSTIAMSFIEAEYIAVTEASMEAVWMRKFIDGLGGVIT